MSSKIRCSRRKCEIARLDGVGSSTTIWSIKSTVRTVWSAMIMSRMCVAVNI